MRTASSESTAHSQQRPEGIQSDGGHKDDKGAKSDVSFWTKMASKLPPWLNSALRNQRTWKTFFRCMIATLATMVLMLAQKCELRFGYGFTDVQHWRLWARPLSSV
jgi:hypothetical protein